MSAPVPTSAALGERSRICVVTGGSKGIGAAVAADLSAAGHRVVLAARDPAALERAAKALPGPVLTVPVDLTAPGAADELFDRVEADWGPAEVLVAAAGAGASAKLTETSDELWEQQLALNLTAPFHCVRRAVPSMRAAGWGRIVVVASVAAKVGAPYVAAYTAAKHGVLGLVRSAAAELAGSGVTVNAVCPGYVDTPMTDATVGAIAARTGRSEDEARAALVRMQPIGRLVRPQEVAAVVRLLLENEALSGQGITVDGGGVQS
ncbi:3-hydroxyacyl-CoA dehydrogenase [Streptacidiphilus pinicola]|uniref:3-hydroxyacyl-CoA dehydrogenase n=1 Tax=Streptacidiphilus pinicola TaxID=2219663 RepID=A0A2X0K2D3_9ACTN|nr:SDR family NAD(P)-dependent oxidoreductase [Streptacidiphilus pinicola]RAG81480.1 3-hydroxyacyl-CoA dehydrogenase [Streptacidiphilus pinicola]